MESAITSKGQATIPKPVRQFLGLKAGDRIKFFLHPNGTVALLPKRPASHLRGVIKSARRSPSIEEMDEAIANGAAEGVARRRARR